MRGSSAAAATAAWLIGLLLVHGHAADVAAPSSSAGVAAPSSADGAPAAAATPPAEAAPSQQGSSCPQAEQDGKITSPLWGCSGEAWSRQGPMTDWSFAGYGAGLEPIPDVPVVVDVQRDFGASGNGVNDDTAAVKAAIDATRESGGAIFFPPGKYILSQVLTLSSYQVLRGAGRDATNLRFTRSLAELQGWGDKYTPGRETSPFTWAGGLITTQRDKGVFAPNVNLSLGKVARPARRGDTRLYVDGLRKPRADEVFVPGEWMSVAMVENEQGDLARVLYNNRTAGGASVRSFKNGAMVSHPSRIVAAGEDWVEMERPLHVDVTLRSPALIVRTANYRVTGIGVEDLEVSFPWTAYMGHHEEPGFNAVEFVGAVNCWARRLRVTNADSGVRLYGSVFNTLSDIQVGNAPWPRRGGRWAGRDHVWQIADMDGHMALALHWASHDNLVERFNISGIYYHDLLVAAFSSRNVFTQGFGIDVCLDHHGAAPSNNLWTDIDLGLGQAAMRWSGDGASNPFAGSHNTFWGVRASRLPVQPDYASRLSAARISASAAAAAVAGARLYMQNRPADIQGYGEIVVDMPLDPDMPTIKEAGDWIVQYEPGRRIWPPNLFRVQRDTQAARLHMPANGMLLSQLYPRPPPGVRPNITQRPWAQLPLSRSSSALRLAAGSNGTAAAAAIAASALASGTSGASLAGLANVAAPAPSAYAGVLADDLMESLRLVIRSAAGLLSVLSTAPSPPGTGPLSPSGPPSAPPSGAPGQGAAVASSAPPSGASAPALTAAGYSWACSSCM